MSLNTGKRLSRRKWTELPMTDEVIAQVHAVAINEDKDEDKDEPTVDFQFSWDRQHNHPIEPFDYSVHEHLIPAPEGADVLPPVPHEEHNVDNISIDNNNTDAATEQEQDQNHSINENDDEQEQDQYLTIEDENMPDDDQIKTAHASDSEDDDADDVDDDGEQGASQLENRGAPEEEAKEQKEEQEALGNEEEDEVDKQDWKTVPHRHNTRGNKRDFSHLFNMQ